MGVTGNGVDVFSGEEAAEVVYWATASRKYAIPHVY